jgi:hypothetical protein
MYCKRSLQLPFAWTHNHDGLGFLLDRMQHRYVISWDAMISGFDRFLMKFVALHNFLEINVELVLNFILDISSATNFCAKIRG